MNMNKPAILSSLKKLFAGTNLIFITVAAAAGIFLLLTSGTETKSKPQDSPFSGAASYEKSLESRIKKLCEAVEGVYGARVMITLDCGSEYVYAENTALRGDNEESELMTVGSGSSEKVVPVRELQPTVRGVAVVCGGGDQPALVLRLTELVSTALGIPSSRVFVCG